MSNLSNKLTNIANSIRTKLNTSNTMKVTDMPSNILNIQTGIEPSGSQTFNQNGTYNVYNIAEAVVNVPADINMSNYAYLVTNRDDMYSLPAEDGEKCIVYETTGGAPEPGNIFNSFIVQPELTMEKIDFGSIYIRCNDDSIGVWCDGRIECYGSNIDMNIRIDDPNTGSTIDVKLMYSLSDSDREAEVGTEVTYTLMSGSYYDGSSETQLVGGENIDFGVDLVTDVFEEQTRPMLKLLTSLIVDDFGVYKFKDTAGWETLEIPTNVTDEDIYSGKRAYTSDGFITGSLGTSTSSKAKTKAAEVFSLTLLNAPNDLNNYFSGSRVASSDIIKVFDTQNISNFSCCFSRTDVTAFPTFDFAENSDLSYMFADTKVSNIENVNNVDFKGSNCHYMFYNIPITSLDNITFSNINHSDCFLLPISTSVSDDFYINNLTIKDVKFTKNFITFPERVLNVYVDGLTFIESADSTYNNGIGTFFAAFVNWQTPLRNLHINNVKFVNIKNASSGENHGMFVPFYNTNLVMTNIDWGEVTDISGMFSMGHSYYNGSLNAPFIDLPNTNITNIANLFRSANVTYTSIANYNTSKVTNFLGWLWTNSINLSQRLSFNYNNAEDLGYLFSNLPNVTSISLSSLNAPNCTKISGMFYSLPNLRSISGNFNNFGNIEDCSYLYTSCKNLSSIATFDTSHVTNFSNAFAELNSYTGNFNWINTSNAIDLNYTFYRVSGGATKFNGLENLDVSKVKYMSHTFSESQMNTSTFRNILNNWDMSNVEFMWNTFKPTTGSGNYDITFNLPNVKHACTILNYQNTAINCVNFIAPNVMDANSLLSWGGGDFYGVFGYETGINSVGNFYAPNFECQTLVYSTIIKTIDRVTIKLFKFGSTIVAGGYNTIISINSINVVDGNNSALPNLYGKNKLVNIPSINLGTTLGNRNISWFSGKLGNMNNLSTQSLVNLTQSLANITIPSDTEGLSMYNLGATGLTYTQIGIIKNLPVYQNLLNNGWQDINIS